MKKYIICGLLAVMLVLPMTAKALTIDELKAQIALLLEQVIQLQQQLAVVKEIKIEEQKPAIFTRALYKGIENNEVTELQGLFAQDPGIYPEGLVTGYFGRLTEAAVKRFQKKHGIEQVGIVGPKTRAKLNTIYGATPAVPAISVTATVPAVPATVTPEVLLAEEDTTAPVDITNFTATGQAGLVILSWINPTDENLFGVKIIRKTGNYPANINDGTQIFIGIGTHYYDDLSLIAGTTYYYKAFAYDRALNYSSGVEATTTPFGVCSGRTLYGECSTKKPQYCDNGELIDNCNLCGCPVSARRKNSEGERCNKRCLENGNCTIFSEGVDCESKHYKMAFILLAQNADELTVKAREETPENRFERVLTIKNEFPQHFAKATRYLASMDTSDDIFIIVGEDLPMRYHEERHLPDYNKIAKKFYETHDDIYDFISIFSTFYIPEWMHHVGSVRNVNGIGRLVPLYDGSATYGSKGKLKGINILRFIDRIGIQSDGEEMGGANSLLHETGHQWCCSVGNNFAQTQLLPGQDKAELEIIQQGIHFYQGLQATCDTGTAMGARNWVSNNDGTFRRAGKWGIYECYHPFQLYFMGLLPKEEYGIKHQVYDATEYQRAVPYKQVSVNDIIELEGERECVVE